MSLQKDYMNRLDLRSSSINKALSLLLIFLQITLYCNLSYGQPTTTSTKASSSQVKTTTSTTDILLASYTSTPYVGPTTSSTDPKLVPLIKPLKLGEKAPWPGLLLNSIAVAQIKVDLDFAKNTCALELDRVIGQEKAKCTLQMDLLRSDCAKQTAISDAMIKSKSEEILSLQKRLEQAEKDRPNIYFWGGLGLLVGIGLTVLTGYAISRAVN